MGNNQPPEPLQPCIKQLQTAANRIEGALKEASPSVEQLGSAFTSIVLHSRQLNDLTEKQGDDNSRQEMQASCSKIEHEAGQAIIGFQFYDRLSQRLEHVRSSLLAIAELMENTDPHPNLQDWEELVVKIVDTLCLDDDRLAVAEALDHHIGATKNKQEENEIELF